MWVPDRFAAIQPAETKVVPFLCAWSAGMWIGLGVGLVCNRWQDGLAIGIVAQFVVLLFGGPLSMAVRT